MNDDKHYAELASKWLDGTISEEEKKAFAEWYDKLPEEINVPSAHAKNRKQHRNRLLTKIQTAKAAGQPTRKLDTIPWLKSAAAVFLVAGLSAMAFYFYNDYPKEKLAGQQDIQIQPGKDRATLTLADGRTIDLEDSTMASALRDDAVRIAKDEKGLLTYYLDAGAGKQSKQHTNTIKTPRGGQYQVVLPDGSKVWLNAASSIVFTIADQEFRRIKLTGEAYFEVAPKENQPFIVETSTQTIQVLGTSFNVNAYADEATVRTALASGKVLIEHASASGTASPKHILQPGEQASTESEDSRVRISPVNLDHISSWKDGYFSFENNNLKELLLQIQRWYDIEVIYDTEALPENDVFAGKVSRNTDFESMLNILSKIGVQFKLEGKKLTIQHTHV